MVALSHTPQLLIIRGTQKHVACHELACTIEDLSKISKPLLLIAGLSALFKTGFASRKCQPGSHVGRKATSSTIQHGVNTSANEAP